MDNLEQNIRKLVSDVLNDMKLTQETSLQTGKLGIFTNINDAINAASNAFKEYIELPLDTRIKIIDNIRKVSHENNKIMSKMAHEETGYGRYEDKIAKNILGIDKTPGVEDIKPEAFSDEHGLTIVERAPYGVIGAITPSTNSTISIISNAIGMLAAGNTVVFNAHPAAKKVSVYIIDFINRAIMEKGGPENVVTCIKNPTIDSAKALMAHPKISIMVVTGGPAVVKTAMSHQKKVIAAGPGNPPVVVDETADIEKAGKSIVDGASFDNNVICICEKETLVVESVADKLKEAMIRNGAYELKGEQIEKITSLMNDGNILYINRLVMIESLRTIPNKNSKIFRESKKMLGLFEPLDIEQDIYEKAIAFSRFCKSKGIQLKGRCEAIDFLHFMTAKHYGLELISNDGDFDKLETCYSVFSE
ncbi:MAG: aldehyde dehydrogenase [Bacteroidales bacterium]|nr:aldehyde dehydrogenase [Bacteroidales bacterium]